MHEFSLCESILDSIAEQARRHGFRRVRRVVLDIGELANVELEALRFAFEITAPYPYSWRQCPHSRSAYGRNVLTR